MVGTSKEANDTGWIKEGYPVALGAAEIGVFRWHLESDRVEWDEMMYHLFRILPGQRVQCLEDVLALIYSPDREKVRAAAAAAKTHTRIEVPFRCQGPDGTLHWLLGRGKVFYNGVGRPLFVAGTCQEIAAPAEEAKAGPLSSEAFLQQITAALPVLISYVDRELRYRYVSAAYEKWFHRPPKDIQDRLVREILGETAYAAAEPYLKRALAGETMVYTEEIPYQGAGARYVHVQYIPDREKGQVRGLSVVVTDLTELHALSKHQAQLAALVETSTDAILSYDPEGRVQSWNPGAERLYGYTAEEMVGQPLTRLIPADRRREAAQALARIQQGQPVAAYETVRRRKDGTPIPVSLTVSPIKDVHGQLIGISSIARDLSATQQAEAALQEKQERLSIALKASGTATYRWDIATNIIQWDERAAALFGLAPEEAARLTTLEGFVELIHPEDRLAFWQHIEVCRRTGADFDLEYRIIEGEGTVRWIMDRGKMFRDRVGQARYMTGACVDITAHKQAEAALRESEMTLQRQARQLQRQTQQLQDVDRRKDEFLAILAHELRNPLATIAHSLQLLKLAGHDPEVLATGVSRAERQIHHLVRLVDDLLDVSRISRGKIELRRERVAIADVVQSALETSRPALEAAGHRLTVNIPETPLWVKGDLIRLAQVVSNLLINAAKYTPAGGHIRLMARQEAREAVITVQDNGVGIPEGMLPTIFEMFVQAHPSQGQAGGLGVGLPLVKGLAELHGGRVEAASAGPGQGSLFTVRLPLVETDEGKRAPEDRSEEAPEGRKGRRILIVDDNKEVADSLAEVLRLLDHQVAIAYEGESALERVQVYRPEVVLLDLGLPGMDGWEVARRLRQQPGGKRMRLIAITGWGQAADRQRTRDAGFDHHLVKPVEFQALVKLLSVKSIG
jgi:PAS domain S-box-containing protein